MSHAPEVTTRTEVRDGMRISWHVPIAMDDGIVLRADVYRPVAEGRYPVILSHGIYAKGLSHQEACPMQWQKMVADHPEILEGSTNRYQAWEVTDPERWVPHGYAVVRVDSRGAGWSPGFMDPLCPREDDDLYQCIEWAGTQPWSSGKVGMLGISYYAINQWRVATRRPPRLAAIIPWEGFNDFYRDASYHGGILSEFMKRWAPVQALTVQHGLGDRARKNPNTGESVAGPATLSDAELAKNRADPHADLKAHSLDGADLLRLHRSQHADRQRLAARLAPQARPSAEQPWQPWHPHDRVEPLTPGEVYECEGEIGEFGKKFVYGTRGTGGMTHADPENRPRDVFGGKVTLHAGGGRDSYLLLPIIPARATS
jgi:hypothetical protein